MKEWVKKEEGVSFGETSEQQPTGYAAHSDHNSRCNPCVGESVLLVVAQVLAGKAQQQEGGTRQGTEREAQRVIWPMMEAFATASALPPIAETALAMTGITP